MSSDMVEAAALQNQNISKRYESKNDKNKSVIPYIDKGMLSAKFSYIFLFASVGCYHPYLVVFLKSIGIPVSKAGFIAGIRMLVSCFSSPCFNVIGDCTHRNLCIFWFLCITSTLMIFPLPWIAEDAVNVVESRNCSGGSWTGKTIDENSLDADCRKNMLFFIMLAVNIGNAVFTLPIAPYMDPVVVAIVQKREKKTSFTKQRIFGAVGFGIGALLAGIVADNYSYPFVSRYSAVFFIYLPSMILLLISSSFLFKQHRVERSGNDHGNEKNVQEQFLLIVKTSIEWKNFALLVTIVVMGAANGLLYLCTFLLLEELNASRTLMGLSMTCLCIAELAMYPLSSKFMKLCGGPYPCVVIGVFSYFLRFILFSLIENAWLILPIQILHSFGYALFWEAVLAIIELSTPRKILLPMLAFAQSLFFDFGFMIAFISGGIAYDEYKGRLLFRGASYISLVWSIVIAVIFYAMQTFKRKRSDTEIELVST